MDAFGISCESRWLIGEQMTERFLDDRAKSLNRRIVGVEARLRGLACLWRQAFLDSKAARRLALDFDVERNGRIQLERQSVKRRWRAFAQLKLKFANVLLRLSRFDRAQVERGLDNVAADFQVLRGPDNIGHDDGLESLLGHVG